jgi:hypothetical protein
VKSQLSEAASLLTSAKDVASKGIWRSRIIQANVQGSSGFYPSETLRTYGATAFPAGTQVYFDHPSAAEEYDRPERSVKDLAGVFLDDAHYEDGPDGSGLFTRIQFFPDAREWVQSRAEHVGLSIRASGQVDETPQGRIVRTLEGISVDLVTRAGAGGRLVVMTESAVAAASQGNGVNSSNSNTMQTDTNALVQEVIALREAFSNQSVGMTKLLQFLKERQRETEKQIQESADVSQVIAKLTGADLPSSSRARLAENYRPGQDLDEEIRREREYLKSVLREHDIKESKSDKGSTALGLSESLGSDSKRGTTMDDFAEIESVLSGKLF